MDHNWIEAEKYLKSQEIEKDLIAYIRNISNFSRIEGTFLRRQIDVE